MGIAFIQDKLEIKFLILYIAARLTEPVDGAALQDMTMCDDGIDYFDYAECLNDLVRTEHLRVTEDGRYVITDKGRKNSNICESSLPYSVRKKAEKIIAPAAERLLRLSMLTAEHEMKKGECFVTLAMSDGKGEIIRLKILSSGETQAERIEENFRRHAEKIYGQIIELLDK